MSEVSFLRRPQVLARVGFGKSTLYLKIARGEFPAPVKISTRASAWRSDDVARWIERTSASMPEPRR
jgi:prophage regulatory protein